MKKTPLKFVLGIIMSLGLATGVYQSAIKSTFSDGALKAAQERQIQNSAPATGDKFTDQVFLAPQAQ